MCAFCETLMQESHKQNEIKWSVRSTFADDNVEEALSCEYKKDWLENFSAFKIYGYEYEDDIYVGIDYRKELTEKNGGRCVISPFSEGVQFNYCPMCGKQISKNIKSFEDYSPHIIYIDEKIL